MDAITLLKKDHRTVEDLFKRFEKFSDRPSKGKADVVARIVKELSVHAAAEEAVLYPAIRAGVEDKKIEDLVLESLEEHHIVKWTLSELDGMSPENERFDAKVSVLMESVRHHVEEEEKELFPKIARAFGKERLDEMGAALAEAKKMAPTHPHPRMPDEPPGNVLGAPGAALVDRALDAGRKLIKGATAAAGGNGDGNRRTRQTAGSRR